MKCKNGLEYDECENEAKEDCSGFCEECMDENNDRVIEDLMERT